jgi:hypothetical protein
MGKCMTWSVVGHVMFVLVCLLIAAALGAAGAIGCGYGGTDCGDAGIRIFMVLATGLIALGYIVRFLIGFVLHKIYKSDSRGRM